MVLLNGAVWLPLIGAILHPFLAWCVQRSTSLGSPLVITVAVANLVTAGIFLCFLEPTGSWDISEKDCWAVANGVFFFLGQWFSIQSVKSGDLAVHSSALGLKVLVVGFLSMWVGLEVGSWSLVMGSVLASLAVFLVAGASMTGWRNHRLTVGLTVLACLFFGLNDFLTGWQSREIGIARWLSLMMGTSGLISLVLLIHRRAELFAIFSSLVASPFILGAGFLLGLQALVVNLAFSTYGQPTLSNVVYSSRGVMAVIFLHLIGRKSAPGLAEKQVAGAALMTLALAIVLGT